MNGRTVKNQLLGKLLAVLATHESLTWQALFFLVSKDQMFLAWQRYWSSGRSSLKRWTDPAAVIYQEL
jgi:hypothetical protein